MPTLFILNDGPYGSEKAYNALRLAMALQKDFAVEVRIFLMADAVTAAISSQVTPQGYYNIERMIHAVISKGGFVKLCGSCCDARGVRPLPLIEGVEVSTMAQLAEWTSEADKVLVF